MFFSIQHHSSAAPAHSPNSSFPKRSSSTKIIEIVSSSTCPVSFSRNVYRDTYLPSHSEGSRRKPNPLSSRATR